MAKVFGWSEDNVSLTALRDRQYQPTSGIDVPDRTVTVTATQSNGTLRVMFFTPTRTLTVSNFNVVCTTGATDTGGTTVRKLGLYTTSGQILTCVARSANDTSLATTSSTIYTKAFTSEAGYSSSYTLVAGTTYAVGWLFYNTGGTFAAPAMVAFNPGSGATALANTAFTPVILGAKSSETDITNTAVTIPNANAANAPFVRLT